MSYIDYSVIPRLTIDELCEELSIGRNSAYNLIKNKKIGAIRLGNKWQIPISEVNKYIIQNTNTHHDES